MATTASRNGIRYPPELQAALDWLGARPAEDGLRDLAPLRRHLAIVDASGIPPRQYVEILDLFRLRAEHVAAEAKPLLFDATLPLPKRLRTVAQGLTNIHGAMAAGYLKALRESPPGELSSAGRTPAHLCEAGLAHLAQQYEVAQLVSTPPPQDFWALAQAFFEPLDDGTAESAPALSAAQRMKALLALAAAQPESSSPRETAFLAAYLVAHGSAVDIRHPDSPPVEDDYWLDAAHGFPPTASARRKPSHDATLRYSCAALSRLAQSHVERLGHDEPPEAIGVPHDLLCADYRDVLERAALRWAAPPVRRAPRRRSGYRVQVCTHLAALWRQARDATAAEVELPASDWMILNESAMGYAIMHVAGRIAGLVAGAAIGLRSAADQPWTICIVRWARSENPEHLELGLEVVAPLAEAVRVARSGAGGEPVPALLLPPLPAPQRGEALLTARGAFVPGRFTLIGETGGQVRVVECMADQLAMHTASVEIFEFTREV